MKLIDCLTKHRLSTGSLPPEAKLGKPAVRNSSGQNRENVDVESCRVTLKETKNPTVAYSLAMFQEK